MTLEAGVLVTIILTLMGVIATILGTQAARLKQVETRLDNIKLDNRRLWWYCRKLIDYAYRYRRLDAPPLPNMPILSEDEVPDNE